MAAAVIDSHLHAAHLLLAMMANAPPAECPKQRHPRMPAASTAPVRYSATAGTVYCGRVMPAAVP